MYYLHKGIQLTPDGFPICYLQRDENSTSGWKVCDCEVCRYFVVDTELGNCILRVEKDDADSFEKLSVAFGMHGEKVSRQRIDQIEKSAMGKLRGELGALLREAGSR